MQKIYTVIILVFFDSNKTHFKAKNELENAVIVGWSNNAGA